MSNINTLVKKLKTIADSGLYGNPKAPSFMDNISKNHFTNVSSPIKAVVFAKFYKMANKNKSPVYVPLPNPTAANKEKYKKMMKEIKDAKKTKKKIPKSPSPDYKAMAKAAKKAKANYYKKMGSLK